jgi:hypothetical protein
VDKVKQLRTYVDHDCGNAMPKPRGDLDKPSIRKAPASAAVPLPQPQERAEMAVGGPKSLTVKLTAVDYWALRDFCTQQERQTGRRVTHQEAMVVALHKLLGKAP